MRLKVGEPSLMNRAGISDKIFVMGKRRCGEMPESLKAS